MKYIKIFIVTIFIICGVANAEDKETYWIGKDITVLVFTGDPYSLKLIPIKLTTYEKQEIVLFHKKSGPGIYSFFVKDLVVYGKFGKRVKFKTDGYFLAKRKQISQNYWLEKKSMKYETKKIVKKKADPETDFDFRFEKPKKDEGISIW